MYQKICVAVDGSNTSILAVETAAQIAQAFNAELLLLHVIRPMKIPPELERFLKADDLKTIRANALGDVGREIMQNAQQKAQSLCNSDISQKIVEGDPAPMIMKIAEQFSADLIVMGTRGLNKVEGALIGSISRKVANQTPISVLIVK
jgi:nucleotide-binding universal stress UspA family protein